MRNGLIRSSNGNTHQVIFGIAFVVLVAIFIGIDVISSRYSDSVGYYVHYDDSEDRNTSEQEAIDSWRPSEITELNFIETDSHFKAMEKSIDVNAETNNGSNIDRSDSGKNKTTTGKGILDKNETSAIINSDKLNSTVRGSVEINESMKSNDTRKVFAEIGSIKKSVANIFFLETRCATKKAEESYGESRSFVLNARQCCAVESTARMNPDRPVYVFHSCQLDDDFVATSAPYVGRLMNYENVHVVRLLPEEIFRGTPVEPMFARGALEASAYPVEHTSDLLRLALLWTFGGTYCDLDVVTIKPLSPLGSNWAGIQDGSTVANGVLDVAPTGEAHQMLGEALATVNDHYDPQGWSSNGPELLTKLLLKHCGVKTVTDAVARCRMNFTALPSPFLYPLYYTQYGDFFDESMGPALVKRLKKIAFSVHIWNKMSHDRVAGVGSQQAYSLLAEEFCPEVYANCGERF